MTIPVCTLGIITYNRLPQLLEVIQAYDEHIQYPRKYLHWVISDDGSGTKYKQAVLDQFPHLKIRWFDNARRGMGANWNRMIYESEKLGQFTLCCQDDWLLTEPLNLALGVAFLQHNPHYGMVRYHKLTGHSGLRFAMQEWDTRLGGLDYHHGDNEYVPHMLPYGELLCAFDDNNVFSPYSGGVHLRHQRFTIQYGQYQVGDGFSNTEWDFMVRVNTQIRHNLNMAQRIVMFPHWVESRFKDISPFTYRNTDVETETLKSE